MTTNRILNAEVSLCNICHEKEAEWHPHRRTQTASEESANLYCGRRWFEIYRRGLYCLSPDVSQQRNFFNKRILNEESINLMIQNQIDELVVEEQPGANPRLSMGFPLGAGSDKFGFGFQITVSTIENRHLRSPGSYGWAGIFNTHFWVDPKRDIAAVILMQVLSFYDEACIRVYQGFEELIYRHLD